MKKHEWLLCPICGRFSAKGCAGASRARRCEYHDEHPSWVNENVPGEFTVIAKKCK